MKRLPHIYQLCMCLCVLSPTACNGIVTVKRPINASVYIRHGYVAILAQLRTHVPDIPCSGFVVLRNCCILKFLKNVLLYEAGLFRLPRGAEPMISHDAGVIQTLVRKERNSPYTRKNFKNIIQDENSDKIFSFKSRTYIDVFTTSDWKLLVADV